ncbi:MAG: hypothetical protein JO227_10915 [Acetobacteraceae bacterium]|nr:hypothetical protein [Acetobacteraceae bacterium]
MIPNWSILLVASVLVMFSAFSFGAGVWRELWPGAPPPKPDTRRIPPVVLLVVNGCLALISLSALVSIWFGKTGG